MPTKTTTKTAARKPATARKPVKAAAPASVKAAPEPKRKETKSAKVESSGESAALGFDGAGAQGARAS